MSDVRLVTYGPGEVYWQRFGHNAIWIQNEDLGLDHVFNFGFFDFQQESFFLRFLMGRMLYFSAARMAQKEFDEYIAADRSIRVQKLDLSASQAHALTRFMVNEVQPENRDYLYDYYRDNCSTRVRDALDLAFDGALSSHYNALLAKQNYRDHTRRLTWGDYPLYLALELVLGAPVDEPISRWDEFFIPAVMADALTDSAVVSEDVYLYESAAQGPPAVPGHWWPWYLAFSSLLLLLLAILHRTMAPKLSRRLSIAWLIAAGIMGCAMTFFWLGTDHRVAALNLNLLLFSPLWLLILLPAMRRLTVVLVVFFGAVAVLMTVLPPGQYTADVLAAFLPLNLAAAWVLRLNEFRLQPADQPGVP